jgi:hypothetical protein
MFARALHLTLGVKCKPEKATCPDEAGTQDLPFSRSFAAMPRQIRFNAFMMNCVVHLAPGQWTAPDDGSVGYLDTGYWVELAKTLEQGCSTVCFLAT